MDRHHPGMIVAEVTTAAALVLSGCADDGIEHTPATTSEAAVSTDLNVEEVTPGFPAETLPPAAPPTTSEIERAGDFLDRYNELAESEVREAFAFSQEMAHEIGSSTAIPEVKDAVDFFLENAVLAKLVSLPDAAEGVKPTPLEEDVGELDDNQFYFVPVTPLALSNSPTSLHTQVADGTMAVSDTESTLLTNNTRQLSPQVTRAAFVEALVAIQSLAELGFPADILSNPHTAEDQAACLGIALQQTDVTPRFVMEDGGAPILSYVKATSPSFRIEADTTAASGFSLVQTEQFNQEELDTAFADLVSAYPPLANPQSEIDQKAAELYVTDVLFWTIVQESGLTADQHVTVVAGSVLNSGRCVIG